MTHIQGIDDNEWEQVKSFARGLIAGIRDTNPYLFRDLEDYWHAYDNTLDLNFLSDEEGNVTCTAYSVTPIGYTDTSDFERVLP
jgi:hypothetical protein